MREHLIKLLLERTLLDTGPNEDFFLAGPPAGMRQRPNRAQQVALLADIRRQQRHGRRALAA
jgi:hypothetical protein